MLHPRGYSLEQQLECGEKKMKRERFLIGEDWYIPKLYWAGNSAIVGQTSPM